MKKINIATLGCPNDYHTSLLISTIQSIGWKIAYVNSKKADLIILGSFYEPTKKYKWAPKIFRPKLNKIIEQLDTFSLRRKYKPIVMFNTGENLRHNHFPADFSISSDIGIDSKTHFRLPYWMEMIDWSHEGIIGNKNPRYGDLLRLEKLMKPLGNDFLHRNHEMIIFSSHLREPRISIIKALEEIIKIHKVGAAFDKKIKGHHQSGFQKKNILTEYAFNLCPENSLFPGYVTEKIPEAFYSGCIPVTWIDTNAKIDFNPDAFINLAPLTYDNFEPFRSSFRNINNFIRYADQPLIRVKPSLDGFISFVKNIIQAAC